MKKVFLFLSALLILAGCAKKPDEPRVYCIPLSQWQALTPAQQEDAVKWFNEHAYVAPQNLPYTVAIGDAQFGPPGSLPRVSTSYLKCFRNMYSVGTLNMNAYPFKP